MKPSNQVRVVVDIPVDAAVVPTGCSWRESAPQPLSFTPFEKAVVDRGFPAERWDSLRETFRDLDGPNCSSLPEHF
jgi:hypothetical protein